MTLQHIIPCPQAAAQGFTTVDDPSMVAIVTESAAGEVLSVSIDSTDVDPETRLNPDYPAKDWR